MSRREALLNGCTGLLLFLVAGVVILALVYHVIWGPREVVATVSAREWSRSVWIERARSVRHQAHELPPRARLVGVVPDVVGWRDVPDLASPEALARAREGDTVFRREPVYVPRYTFEVDAWEQDTSFYAHGTTEPPVWPQVTLGPGQRRNGRNESYRLEFTDASGRVFSASSLLSYEEFIRWQVGQAVRLKVYGDGDRVVILGGASAAGGG